MSELAATDIARRGLASGSLPRGVTTSERPPRGALEIDVLGENGLRAALDFEKSKETQG